MEGGAIILEREDGRVALRAGYLPAEDRRDLTGPDIRSRAASWAIRDERRRAGRWWACRPGRA